jgi:hypothetical protein
MPGFCPAPFQAGSVCADSFLTCQNRQTYNALNDNRINSAIDNVHCSEQFLCDNACLQMQKFGYVLN